MPKNPFNGKKQIMMRENSSKLNQSYSLQELHSLFITTKRAEGLRERTIKDHICHFSYLTTWLKENAHNSFLEGDIDIYTLRKYIGFMQEKLLSPVTINIRLRTIKCFLKFIFDEGYCTENLTQKVKLMKTDQDTIKIMTTDQVESLLKVINTKTYTGYRDYVLTMLLLDTGCRIGEAATLTYDQIDFKASTVYFTAELVKTRVGRQVPLSPKVNKLLFNLIEENKGAFNVKEVFLSIYGTPFLKGSFRKRLKTYQNKAQIMGCRVSPHSFRHFYCKSFILGGGEIFSLQRIIGVSSLQVIRKYINMLGNDIKIQHNQFSPVQRFKF